MVNKLNIFYIFLDTLYVSGTWHMVCTICFLNIEALYPTGTLEICCRIAANKQFGMPFLDCVLALQNESETFVCT